jgi:hypothetical protein
LIRLRSAHPFVVVYSFFRERKSRFSSKRKRLFLRARAHIPRKKTRTEIKEARKKYIGGRIVRISGSVQSLVGIEIKEGGSI